MLEWTHILVTSLFIYICPISHLYIYLALEASVFLVLSSLFSCCSSVATYTLTGCLVLTSSSPNPVLSNFKRCFRTRLSLLMLSNILSWAESDICQMLAVGCHTHTNILPLHDWVSNTHQISFKYQKTSPLFNNGALNVLCFRNPPPCLLASLWKGETCSHSNDSRSWSAEPPGLFMSIWFIPDDSDMFQCLSSVSTGDESPGDQKQLEDVIDWSKCWYVWERGLSAGLRHTDCRVTGEATEGGASLHYTYPCKSSYNTLLHPTIIYPWKSS